MDILVLCPYNFAHHIYTSRLPYHLPKCRKRSAIKTEGCPYEATHHVRVEEYDYHIHHCPKFNKDFLELQKEVNHKDRDNNTFNAECQRESRNSHEENWDDTVDQFNAECQRESQNSHEENWDDTAGQVGTYNADEMSKRKKVLRTPSLQSKNERRWFRYQEKKRYAALEKQDLPEKLEEDEAE